MVLIALCFVAESHVRHKATHVEMRPMYCSSMLVRLKCLERD